jgi:hypothetical protein
MANDFRNAYSKYLDFDKHLERVHQLQGEQHSVKTKDLAFSMELKFIGTLMVETIKTGEQLERNAAKIDGQLSIQAAKDANKIRTETPTTTALDTGKPVTA